MAISRRFKTKKCYSPLRSVCRYYALVAACILARKSEWLRNACLAAGLLFPAIAAFHGIVLAAMHNNGQPFGPCWIARLVC